MRIASRRVIPLSRRSFWAAGLLLLLAVLGTGLFFKPTHGWFSRDIPPVSDRSSVGMLALAKNYSRSDHPLRHVLAVSYKVEKFEVPAPPGLRAPCDTVTIVSLHTLYGIGVGRMWIGCGGAEAGFL